MNHEIAITEEMIAKEVERAAKAIKNCNKIVFLAGAGMGVDSGLPDFRGPEGFWKAYPPMKHLGLQFSQCSNPTWFEKDPAFAWEFFGHRYQLYSEKQPHEGYHIMKRFAKMKNNQYFIFTSNVDGHFIRCFEEDDKIEECHGTITHLQCIDACKNDIWSITNRQDFLKQIEFDEHTFRIKQVDQLPKCPHCKKLARPNILMFGDYGWIEKRTLQQQRRREKFENNITSQDRLVCIEVGAGTAIPTVRHQSESYVLDHHATLIRINLRDYQFARHLPQEKCIPLPLGGKDALLRIEEALLKL